MEASEPLVEKQRRKSEPPWLLSVTKDFTAIDKQLIRLTDSVKHVHR